MLRSLAGALALFALVFASSQPAAAADERAFAPALYVVRDADSTLYLFGTIHLRRPGQPWGGPHVEAALAESDEIWTEMEISPASEARAQALALRAGLASPDQPLSSWLEPPDVARLHALLAQLNMAPQALEPMRPWLASLTLAIVPMMQAGYDPQAGVDRAVAAWGVANGRTMRAFETAEEQIGFFANLGAAAQRELLLSSINEAENAVAMADAMTAAWERGELETLERITIDQMRETYPEMYEVLFTQRNNAWMAVLLEQLAGSGVDFVAVGAGHIVGPEGLAAQLRAAGYTVERAPAP